MNYPPGMTRRDWDHVWGVSRCSNCGAELPEEINCKTCGTSGVTAPDECGQRDPCPDCEEPRERLREGECPDGCLTEDPHNDYDYVRDREMDDRANGVRDEW